MPAHNFKSILITGGSSGIGLAVARELATPGVSITITGQNEARLQAAKGLISETGAIVKAVNVDVSDADAMSTLINEADHTVPLDLVIANAGISAGNDQSVPPHNQIRRIISVNVIGVMNTVLPAMDLMAARGSGRIAIVSSIAGLRGLPTAPAYSASKVAVKAWGDAIRPGLRASGVGLSIIYPGFVISRITDQNTFPMPFLMPAEKAASFIVKQLVKGKASIAFPWPMVLMMRVMSMLPGPIFDWLMAKGPKKL